MAAFNYRRSVKIAASALVAIFFCAPAALSADRSIPTPRVTIYPGDRIEEDMLEDVSVQAEAAAERDRPASRSELVGKIARRTLLPGQPIPQIAVQSPRVVTIGAQVKIVFSESSLYITAVGTALQAGGVGDMIRVRNQDSGLTVYGRVLEDGSVKVSEG